MRASLFIAWLLLALGAGPMRADEAGEIRAVISGQITAFEADDFAAAFDFASQGIRRQFATPEQFGAMVRSGYPMVWRPAELRFTGLSLRDGRRIQGVLITDGDGALHLLDYEMIQGPDGWRINGVRPRSGGAGA